jgi:hypothetical protein
VTVDRCSLEFSSALVSPGRSPDSPLAPTAVLSAATPLCMCTARQAVRMLLERAESGHHLKNHLFLAHPRSASCVCTQTSPRRWPARAGAGVSFWDIIFLGVATWLRRVSALGCHLHERGRGWPPFSYSGADDLKPILVTCMGRGNEARIRSGHHPRNDLCLACLKIAPRLRTPTSPRRGAYVPEPLGYLPWRGCMTAPRFGTWLPPS